MSLADAMGLFQEQFQILSRRITGKSYAIRFFGVPYSTDAPSILLYTDSRNPEHISGPSIRSTIEKFKITEMDFRSAYNEFYARRGRRS